MSDPILDLQNDNGLGSNDKGSTIRPPIGSSNLFPPFTFIRRSKIAYRVTGLKQLIEPTLQGIQEEGGTPFGFIVYEVVKTLVDEEQENIYCLGLGLVYSKPIHEVSGELSAIEFYHMTLGEFQRRPVGISENSDEEFHVESYFLEEEQVARIPTGRDILELLEKQKFKEFQFHSAETEINKIEFTYFPYEAFSNLMRVSALHNGCNKDMVIFSGCKLEYGITINDYTSDLYDGNHEPSLPYFTLKAEVGYSQIPEGLENDEINHPVPLILFGYGCPPGWAAGSEITELVLQNFQVNPCQEGEEISNELGDFRKVLNQTLIKWRIAMDRLTKLIS